MKIISIKYICLVFLALLIIFTPCKKSNASPPNWISVPSSQYGEQLWDKNSLQKNENGSITVFSKFIPKSTTEITQDILYIIDNNCSKNSFMNIV